MFVLLAMPRTGSHLLQTGIDQHPKVEAYLEALKRNRQYFIGGETSVEYPNTEAFLHYIKEYEENIDKEVGVISHIQAYMFRPMAMSVVNELCDNVIRLTRENVLRRIVSFAKAQRTRQWQLWSESEEQNRVTDVQVKVSREEFEYALRIQEYHQKMDRPLSDTNIIEVSYEEQVENYQSVLERVWSALGLSPVTADKKLRKQTPEPIKDVVSNYEEFKDLAQEFGLDDFLEE